MDARLFTAPKPIRPTLLTSPRITPRPAPEMLDLPQPVCSSHQQALVANLDQELKGECEFSIAEGLAPDFTELSTEKLFGYSPAQFTVAMGSLFQAITDHNQYLSCLPTKYTAISIPSISIQDFMQRCEKYMPMESSDIICVHILIDVYMDNKRDVFHQLNFHRLFLIASVLVLKWKEDLYYANAYYAKVGGVPTDELNSLEVDFLFDINFDLYTMRKSYSYYVGLIQDYFRLHRAEIDMLIKSREVAETPSQGLKM